MSRGGAGEGEGGRRERGEGREEGGKIKVGMGGNVPLGTSGSGGGAKRRDRRV